VLAIPVPLSLAVHPLTSRPIQEAEVVLAEVDSQVAVVVQADIDSQMTIEARAEISLLKLCLLASRW